MRWKAGALSEPAPRESVGQGYFQGQKGNRGRESFVVASADGWCPPGLKRLPTPFPPPLCIELKSLKLYLQGFRNEGIFYEDVTNRILDDLVKALAPRFMRLSARFYVRGGIFTTVIAEHAKRGWKITSLPEYAENVSVAGTSQAHQARGAR